MTLGEINDAPIAVEREYLAPTDNQLFKGSDPALITLRVQLHHERQEHLYLYIAKSSLGENNKISILLILPLDAITLYYPRSF